jgi:hypothetical protein
VALFSGESVPPASAPVVKLRESEKYEHWKRTIRALLLGQALWKHALGQVPIPSTKAQKDREAAVEKAKLTGDLPPRPAAWSVTAEETQAIEQ